jgi:nucleoside-diphosphate-sugar epimerase
MQLQCNMSACSPQPEEPAIRKDESHWCDSDAQRAAGNWYGRTKTVQERTVLDWVETARARGTVSAADFVYAAIYPAMVIGPVLKEPKGSSNRRCITEGTVRILEKWLREGRDSVNDSMSFIHVEDCARMHTAILELARADINPNQRYTSLVESWHWNDLSKLVTKELHPAMPDYKPYENDDLLPPTQFNLENMKS